MLDFFDGFYQPGGEVSLESSPVMNNQMSCLLLAQAPNTVVAIGGGRLRTGTTSTSTRTFLYVSRTVLPVEGRAKLVLGVRMSASLSASVNQGAAIGAPIAAPGAGTSSIQTATNVLPCLYAFTTPEGWTIRLRDATSNFQITTSNSLAQLVLTGLDITKEHMYELEYAFDENKVNVWIDDVLVLSHPYTYTLAQKQLQTAQLGVFKSFQTQGNITLGLVYSGDERVGRAKVLNKVPSADSAVDTVAFGPGPAYPKVSTTFDPASENTLRTKVSGKALFNTNQPIDSTPIAVQLTSRHITYNRSAKETEATLAFLTSDGSSEVQSDKTTMTTAIGISKQTMRKHPLSGADWTIESVNSLKVGVALEVKDRFPSV